MKAIVILIFSACFFSCSQNRKNSVKLIDSALNLTFNYRTGRPFLHTKKDTETRDVVYGKALGLLNKAIETDKKSPAIYVFKLMLFRSIQQYDSALNVTTRMFELWPKSPLVDIYTGNIREEMGDTIASKFYFKFALSSFNEILAVSNKEAKIYKLYGRVNMETDRAVLLIMLNQQKKGDSLLNNLYNRETDTLKRASILKYMGKTKKEILAQGSWY